MSKISIGNTPFTALVQTADLSGNLIIETAGVTAMVIDNQQNITLSGDTIYSGNVDFSSATFSAPVGATNGGTGLTSPGTSGNVLTSNGTSWLTRSLTDAGIAGVTTSQTLTNKTIEAGTFTNGYTEETVSANTGSAYTIGLANGTVQILTLTDTCTYTFPTPTAGKSFLLVQKQDGVGSRTVTWDAAVKWPASTAPTITSTASKADLFSFVADGTYWYGRTIGQNYL